MKRQMWKWIHLDFHGESGTKTESATREDNPDDVPKGMQCGTEQKDEVLASGRIFQEGMEDKVCMHRFPTKQPLQNLDMTLVAS